MAPRKPTWDWKARACAEFDYFTVPYAIKEYVQNVVGQALKDLQVREWSDWTREDLRELTPKQREQRKKSLVLAYPGLLTGPHGAAVKRVKAWEPWYILSATIPQARLRAIFTTTDLRIALVVWRHTTIGIGALSVYNNHLDARAKFSSFTVDGASTSRASQWAVGEKGKGFILATQFLLEWVERYVSSLRARGIEIPKEVKEGISFRVGHQIGTLKWKKSRYDDEDDLLQVVLDDLTPLTVEEHMEKQAAAAAQAAKRKNSYSSDEEDDDDVDLYGYRATTSTSETPKMRKTAETALKNIYSRRVTQQLDSKGDTDVLHNRGRCLISSDEVAVTAVGLDGDFQPEYLFSAIYGIIPPAQAWRVPGTLVQFFIAPIDQTTPAPDSNNSRTTLFYHRDQYVPFGPHANHHLSINYHGNLSISSDRTSIQRDRKITAYKRELATSVDDAFRTIPELALELAFGILSDDHSEGFAGILHPRDKLGADAYRAAFDGALRKLHPEIAADAQIHPTSGSVTETLFGEMELTPVSVSSKAWEIIESSGAYISIEEHARQVLLAADPVPESQGLKRLRIALSVVAPDVTPESITVRDYDKSSPSVVWDDSGKLFAFALPPKCEDHPDGACFCWIGPFLHEAAREYDGPHLGTRKLFRAYLLCMNGQANMEADEDEEPEPNVDNSDSMDIDDFTHVEDIEVRKTPARSRKARSETFFGTNIQPDEPAPKSPALVTATPTHSVQPTQVPQRASMPRAQPPASTSRATLDSPVRAPDAAPSAPQPPPNPADSPERWRPALLNTDEDAALSSVAALVSNYKDQKVALADAAAIMNDLQGEINLYKAAHDDLSVRMEVLKIDCATHQHRIEELGQVVQAKDAVIAELQGRVEEMQEQMEAADAAAEAYLKARKKPRNE